MNNRKKRYPVKTSVNLLYRKKSNISPVQMLLAAVVFVVILAVFSKFAVIDRLAVAAKAQQEAKEIERALADVQQSNSNYEEVLQEYQHYYFSAADNVNGGPEAFVDCLDVFELLESELLHKAGVQSVNLTGDVLTLNLTEITLEDASVIAGSLEKNELVSDVRVSAANRQQASEGTTVNLILVLKTENAAGQGADTQNMNAGEDE